MLEKYLLIKASKPTTTTIKYLAACRKTVTAINYKCKKVLTAIETGIMAFEEGEELKRLELLQLLKSVKNGISQIISSMESEAIGAKYKQMEDEIRKQEPQFMSNDLAIKISFIDINESQELD
uniref:V-type ATP synthase subunit D n=1 Tax=Strongyloides venezuelensis TaxID=75913 RepID=A0A0K0FZ96_STRVS